ncbi:Bug family tripartite tricarboxylate transporter substrate binding protein [Pseudorhodoferax sp.]|uniref:Bug family tripartite tricarboxylate transporter substrate binding protein n=1 Tax=Pseudorhodoferax sp. TaxID=1993553 RepID=UPI0039E5DF9D
MKNHACAPARRSWLRAAGTAAAIGWGVLALAPTASAQAWPTRPVRIVIASSAGSSGDLLARMLAPRLESLWKQPVVVEPKPGASGIVGTEYVINVNDGHTLLLGTQTALMSKFTQKNLRFDPLADLLPVAKVIHYQMVIATNAPTARQAGTLAALVALSKSTPDGLFFAGNGPTSIFNLSMAIMNRDLGLRMATVDFPSVSAMNLALLRNDAQLMVNTPSSVKGQIDNGTVVPLAAVNPERYANLPQVPTLKEATGYGGYLPLLWAGFFAPRGTPAAVIQKIDQDLRAALDDQLKQQIESTLTGNVVASSPAVFAREIQAETAVWRDIFKAMDFKPE